MNTMADGAALIDIWNATDKPGSMFDEHLSRFLDAAISARQPHGEESCESVEEELQFYREEAFNLPNILIAAGVFTIEHEGDYKAAWANIMDAIERLAARQPVGQELVSKSVGIDALVQLLADDAEECAKGWVERGDAYASGKSAGLLAAADYFRKIATSQRWSEFLSSPAQVVDDDWHLRGYAYASKQATTCAGCGEHKHTPLRIDAMGGYVCLTCIDKKLSTLLGEFGYESAQAVDLGQFREAVLCWAEAAENDLTDERGNEAARLLGLINSSSGVK